MRNSLLVALLFAALLLGGCGGDDDGEKAPGTVSVRAYGESFIEDGIPADEMNDGWAVDFSRFDVTLQDVVVAGVAVADPAPVDVSAASDGEGHEVGSVTVKPGDYTAPSFTIARVEVAGSAEKDGVTKTFDWVFDAPTRYERCETTTAVASNEEATFQITLHADHFFYDSLVSEEPLLLFQPLADADADGDGELTQAELEDTDIGGLDPGNEDVNDLWAWLVAQHRTLGHVDGEGHCEASAAE